MNLQWYYFPFQNREGWFNIQGPKMIISSQKSFWESVALIACSTESGGVVSAYNGYDQCVVTLGILQFAGSVAGSPLMKLITKFYELDKDLVIKHLQPALDKVPGSELIYNNGKCLFKIDGVEVIKFAEWCNLIQEGVSGVKGTWTPSAKETSKIWAECFIKLAEEPKFIEVQKKFFINSLKTTYFANANIQVIDEETGNKVIVKPLDVFNYNESTIESELNYKRALIATYISYGANIPALASKKLYENLVKHPERSWTEKFKYFALACKSSTVKEWSIRWNKISALLVQEFGVDIDLNIDPSTTYLDEITIIS